MININKKLIYQQLHDITPINADIFSRLEQFVDLLLLENQKHNLIGKSTEDIVWYRHIIDSAQLMKFLQNKQTNILTDFGSGAGFPGIVLSILGIPTTNLIEVRQKKVNFLEKASTFSNNNINIIRERIENIKPFASDVITARALAPLPKLLDLTYPFLQQSKYALFFKGSNAKGEVLTAKKHYKFNCKLITSISSPESYILEIKGDSVSRKISQKSIK